MRLLIWALVLAVLFSPAECIKFTDKLIRRYREKVRAMFYHAYNGYLDNAFPLDELKPLTCVGQDTWGSFSLSLVDALDTLLVMGNGTEFRRAVDLVLKSVRTDANVNVSVFETNIRVVGGLLAAHMLSGRVEGMELEEGWPCDGPLLRLAEEMASKLLPAFNTDTGMPFGTVNLRYGVHRSETPITCTAGVGTFIIEFGTLSRLTGDDTYEKVAMKALDSLYKTRSSIGLVGNHINIQTGQWTATDAGIGAGVDSYFEYLVKGAYLFQKPSLMRQFHEYASVINRYVRKEDWFMWVSMQNGAVTLPIFQSLEAFWPGLLTLIGDVEDATRIMLQYGQVIKQYGFPPEFYNIPNRTADKRAAFPLRPEMPESLMYLYRATEDPIFLELGAQIIDAIEHSAKTKCGYGTIHNVNDHSIEDRMESFFLAETTKYLYLLFDPKNFLHNDGSHARGIDTPKGRCAIEGGGYIFNTEAHPMDPGIIHCCSAQHEIERKTIKKWGSNMNFMNLLMELEEETAAAEDEADEGGDFSSLEAEMKAMSSSRDRRLRLPKHSKTKAYKMEQKMKADPYPISIESEGFLYDVYPKRDKKGRVIKKNSSKRPTKTAFQLNSTVTPHLQSAKPVDDQEANITDKEEVIKEVRKLIRKARMLDEEKTERGEKSNIAETLVNQLHKMYAEYKDIVNKAKELDDMDVEEMKRRIAKRHYVEGIPVAEADCEKCCYPMESIGESVAFRRMMDYIHRAHIYPKNNIAFTIGPLCRPRDVPKIEDSFRNVAPEVPTRKPPPRRRGYVPPLPAFAAHDSLFDEKVKLDFSEMGYSILKSPPLPASNKFLGSARVPPRANSSWYWKKIP